MDVIAPARDSRTSLIVPIAGAVTAMWLAAGVGAVYTGNVQVFVIASGPFTLMCGYVFGVNIVRKVGNGNGGKE